MVRTLVRLAGHGHAPPRKCTGSLAMTIALRAWKMSMDTRLVDTLRWVLRWQTQDLRQEPPALADDDPLTALGPPRLPRATLWVCQTSRP
ncbi:MAG: hypothetical protein INH41_16265 [Myxococcaceae bacterium]|jgi:hypothetical protein|nr:hypothetical protein [Myxococcaceae bacterium]